jgi:snapalysin
VTLTRSRTAVIASILTVLAVLLGGQAPAVAATRVQTFYYNDSQAAPYQSEIAQAVQNWNQSVHNVQLKPGGSDITIFTDSGWPYTEPQSPGRGTVDIGQEAINEGYDTTRIAAHELGHILGLDDNYNGDCNALMSGHSAGTSCTNAFPDAAEIAQVTSIFASGRHIVLHKTIEISPR